MGAKASSHAFDIENTDMIELFFLKAGKSRELRPRERLIAEGDTVGSIFLITEGEVILKKKPASGQGPAKVIGKSRGKGSMLGELSMLLNVPASVSVEAPPGSGASALELPQQQLLGMLQSDPNLAGGFFRLLGATLASRITEISTQLQKAVVTSPTAQASSQVVSILPQSLDTPVGEIAAEFGLDPDSAEMILHCDVGMAVEENSVMDSNTQKGKLYLFEGHLCLETALFGFSNRRAIELHDVLAVLKKGASVASSSASGGSGASDAVGGSSVEVQCRALSLTLTLPSQVYEHVVLQIEAARVAAIDVTELMSHRAPNTASAGEQLRAAGSDASEDVRSMSRALTMGRYSAQTGINQANQAGINQSDIIQGSSNEHARRGAAVWQPDENVLQQMEGGGSSGDAASDGAGRRRSFAMSAMSDSLKRLSRRSGSSSSSSLSAPRIIRDLSSLTSEQWGFFLKGAEQLRFQQGEHIIQEGDSNRALYQMVHGHARVELAVKGRPQAVVLGKRQMGDLFGERSLLNGGNAKASIVVDSDTAVVLRVTMPFLQELFVAHPEMMGKFFCLLAIDQAKRLTKLTREADSTSQLVLPEGLHAPTEIDALLRSSAYLTILTRYVQSRHAGVGVAGADARMAPSSAPELAASPAAPAIPSESVVSSAAPAPSEPRPLASQTNGSHSQPHTNHSTPRRKPAADKKGGFKKKKTDATPRKAGAASTPQSSLAPASAPGPARSADEILVAQLEFVTDLRTLRAEPDPRTLHTLVQGCFAKFFARASPKAVGVLTDDALAALEREVSARTESMNFHTHPSQMRKLFDAAEALVVDAIDAACLSAFLASSHYNYVVSLVLKQQAVPGMEQFKATKVLGEGGFGQVLEVVKRDCGKTYAMKVMKKKDLMQSFEGEDWKAVVSLEQQLQAQLHHPLIVNLAYSFQNTGYLVLVMDACPGGDLSTFALTDDKLTPTQARAIEWAQGIRGGPMHALVPRVRRHPERHLALTASSPAAHLRVPQVKFVGLEVTAVLAHLHTQKILYRDIKPENLLLDAVGHVRLIDFGLALGGANDVPTSDEMCGTPCYMAPEVRYAGKKGVKKYSAPADWYTLGVLMYELTEQALPFGDEPAFRDIKAVRATTCIYPPAHRVPPACRTLGRPPNARVRMARSRCVRRSGANRSSSSTTTAKKTIICTTSSRGCLNGSLTSALAAPRPAGAQPARPRSRRTSTGGRPSGSSSSCAACPRRCDRMLTSAPGRRSARPSCASSSARRSRRRCAWRQPMRAPPRRARAAGRATSRLGSLRMTASSMCQNGISSPHTPSSRSTLRRWPPASRSSDNRQARTNTGHMDMDMRLFARPWARALCFVGRARWYIREGAETRRDAR